MNNPNSSLNSPTPNAEEEAVSAPLEKLPKLNLPPKPVLATAANTPAAPSSAAAAPSPATTATAKPMTEPPPIKAASVAPTPNSAGTQQKKSELQETSLKNKNDTSLSMPLAIIALVAALVALTIEIFTFLHL